MLLINAVLFAVKVAWYLFKVYRGGGWVNSLSTENTGNPDAVPVGKREIKSVKVEYTDGSIETF